MSKKKKPRPKFSRQAKEAKRQNKELSGLWFEFKMPDPKDPSNVTEVIRGHKNKDLNAKARRICKTQMSAALYKKPMAWRVTVQSVGVTIDDFEFDPFTVVRFLKLDDMMNEIVSKTNKLEIGLNFLYLHVHMECLGDRPVRDDDLLGIDAA